MPDKMQSKEMQQARKNFIGAMMRLHSAISRERQPLGKLDAASYTESTKSVARICCENIMCALAGPQSTHLFEGIMTDAVQETVENSKNGTVCPCCGETWHG